LVLSADDVSCHLWKRTKWVFAKANINIIGPGYLWFFGLLIFNFMSWYLCTPLVLFVAIFWDRYFVVFVFADAVSCHLWKRTKWVFVKANIHIIGTGNLWFFSACQFLILCRDICVPHCYRLSLYFGTDILLFIFMLLWWYWAIYMIHICWHCNLVVKYVLKGSLIYLYLFLLMMFIFLVLLICGFQLFLCKYIYFLLLYPFGLFFLVIFGWIFKM
jgi:hypothetical protein